MGLYTKLDEQKDNYYEVASLKKSLSKLIFYFKVIVLLLLIFNIFVIAERFFILIHNSIDFFFA